MYKSYVAAVVSTVCSILGMCRIRLEYVNATHVFYNIIFC